MLYNGHAFVRCVVRSEDLDEVLDLNRLFDPSAVAVIGASVDRHKAGGRFLKDLIDDGYAGTIYPVNPGASDIMGMRCYSSVADLPQGIDLAIVAVPSRIVPAVVAECSRQKVKFIIVHSAGFAELGSEGNQLENAMVGTVRAGESRIVGPNCMGIYVPRSRINMIVHGAPIGDPGGVAFVGQSGWVTENVVVLGRERGLRFSKIASIGNQSDLTIEDMIGYLADDEETRVIALYAEGIKRGREFLKVVKEAGRRKPVIVWKSGRSAIGARAASSHTGSLAGDAVVFDAAAAQAGLIQAHDLDDLLDLMVGFSCPVYPGGRRVALLCESGGGAVSGSDAAEMYGLELPTLSPEAQRKLVETLTGRIPPFATPRNPVDIVWGPADDPTGLFVACGRVMLGETDAAVMLDYQRFDGALSREIAGLRDNTGKPVFVVPGYVTPSRSGMAVLTAGGVPAFSSPKRALKVLSEVVRYSLTVRGQ
jgi:acyl-CoA synthetase (NDP forming)